MRKQLGAPAAAATDAATKGYVDGIAAQGIPGPVGMNLRGPWVSTTTYAKYDAATLDLGSAGTVLFQVTGASGDIGTTPGTAVGTAVTPNAPWSVVVTGTPGPPGTGGAGPTGLIVPSDLGYKAFVFDPLLHDGSSAFLQAGQLIGTRMNLPACTPAAVGFHIWVAGAGMTNGYIGLISAADGSRIAVTAELSSTWTGTGFREVNFATSVAWGGGAVYAVGLVGAATTAPKLASARGGDSLMMNARAPGSLVRCGQVGNASGLTVIPASGTAIANSSVQNRAPWFGVR